MADVVSRVAAADYLMSEVGSLLAIPDFAFDDNNECNVEYGDKALNLKYVPANGVIVVTHTLEVEQFLETADLLVLILATNRKSASNGLGAIAYDPDEGELIWIDRIELRGLTAMMFVEAVDRIYQAISFWKTDIMSRVSETGSTHSHSESHTAPSDPQLIFRA